MIKVNDVSFFAVSAVVPALPAFPPGLKEDAPRRAAPDGVTAADLCVKAAERLFEKTEAETATTGAVIFVSYTPDYLLPSTAAIIHHMLGLPKNCAAFDINSGGAGYLHGLWLASSLIASGSCSSVLLLVGDTPARFLGHDNGSRGCFLGDAGTATLLVRDSSAKPLSFLFGLDSSMYESSIIPGGGSRIPFRKDEGPESAFKQFVTDRTGAAWSLARYAQVWNDRSAVSGHVEKTLARHIRRHLAFAGVEVKDVSCCVVNLAGVEYLGRVACDVGFSKEQTPDMLNHTFGYLGAASIPVALCARPSKNARSPAGKPGLLCGYGAGMAWGTCLCYLGNTKMLPVFDYLADPALPGREELILSWQKKYGKK